MEDCEIRVPKPGERYRHYKGGIYEVIAVGRLSEERDQLMVVYKSIDRGHVWIRPLGMWSEHVEWTVKTAPVGLVFDQEVVTTHRAMRFSLMEVA